MLYRDCFIMMGLGGLFIILGLGAIFWGKREARGYYDSLATRTDVREFLEHTPYRPTLGALKVGGWIAISIGLLLIVMGGAFLLWG